MRRAFTLIELLVVISIIALLIAILLPVLGSARRSAQLTQCLVNHRQIGVGLTGYAVEHKGDFPAHPGQGGNRSPYFYVHTNTHPDGTRINLAKAVLDYQTDSAAIFVCPLAPRHEPPDPEATTSARWNYYYMPHYKSGSYESPITNMASGTSEDGLWGEHTADVGPSWGNMRSNHTNNAAGTWNQDNDANLGPSYAQWSSDSADDVDSISVVFVDGSARLLGTEQMYIQPSPGLGFNLLPPNSEYPAP